MDPSVTIPAPPQGRLILTHIGTLVTGNKELGDIDDAAVAIKDNVIEWVGKTVDLPADMAADRGTKDCSHIMVATPGFINTHHHFYQTITRGVS